MSSQRYSPEFKDEAVRQVTQRGYPVKEVAERVGVSEHSLYKWIRASRPARAEAAELSAAKLELQKLKAELRRVQEERDILKKAAAYFAKDPE
ncbi:transposase [Patescibacteria group bacterium]|nr:transposase [Patescibacteria group bacterium]